MEAPREDAWASDRALCARIAAGDETAFAALIDTLYLPLRRVAEAYVGRGPLADDVVQETWVSVVAHLGEFQGRSALRTWVTRILINHAKTRRERERRFTSLEDDAEGYGQPIEQRFSAVGFFSALPGCLESPEEQLLTKEASGWLVAELEHLPDVQRAVVTLRDVEEWSSEEVCNALGLSESNQRVLLHRGRQRLRAALEERVCGTRKSKGPR